MEEAQKYLKSRKPPVDRMFYNYLEEADGGNVKFKTHHFGTQGAHSLDEESRPRQRLESEGFALNFRVAPRWLRGIIFRVDRKPTREEIKKSWEDFNAQNLKNFPWEKPIALDEEFIRVYAPKTIINKEKETNEKRAKEIAQAMLSSTQDSNKFLPIYDIYGNLWWPKQMNYEEVKKFVEERDKDKIDPETSSG